jgi:pimeloyl-ACP methyl ester carboxylesterase
MRLNAGGHQLQYEWHGPPPDHAPTLVFLHEGLGCVETWRDFPARVAAATGCGAMVYSRAGYGKSDPVALPRPTSFMHEEALTTLPQVLEATKVRDAILFGHSDGASIALIHAGSGSATCLRGLVLEAPHVFVEDISVASIAKAADNYENGDLKKRLQQYHGDNVDCAFWGWNRVWLDPAFRDWNIEEYLPKISVPILVIQGENDEYGTLRQIEAIEKGCAVDMEKLILPSCGHSPHRDHPELVIEKTASFVAKIINELQRD